jgi:hypothetical protein
MKCPKILHSMVPDHPQTQTSYEDMNGHTSEDGNSTGLRVVDLIEGVRFFESVSASLEE